MRISRTSLCIVASILVLVLVVTAAQTNILPAKNWDTPMLSTATLELGESEEPTHVTEGKNVTIFLHGLMVGRYQAGDNSTKSFELGIVKRVPGHEFDFNVYVAGQKKCKPISIPKRKGMNHFIFEVRKNDVAIPRDIQMWDSTNQLGKTSETSTSLAMFEDSDRILNIEDLHSTSARKELSRYDNAFNRFFYFHNGKVKAETVTDPLEIYKGDADDSEQGERPKKIIAEVVGVEITLEPDQELVLWNADTGSVKWRNKYSPKTVEGRILNLPTDHKAPCCKSSYISCATQCPPRVRHKLIPLKDFLQLLASNNVANRSSRAIADEQIPTHFQNYYYLVFDVNRPLRFELNNPDPVCYRVVQNGGKVRNRNDGGVGTMTVPPYRCGMVLINNGEIK
jgi:hypothetical protein